jgi:hypothetical protein
MLNRITKPWYIKIPCLFTSFQQAYFIGDAWFIIHKFAY